MHYPPETSSIMLMAKMVAMVKQVRLFIYSFENIQVFVLMLSIRDVIQTLLCKGT